jgi:hypothetical protein
MADIMEDIMDIMNNHIMEVITDMDIMEAITDMGIMGDITDIMVDLNL